MALHPSECPMAIHRNLRLLLLNGGHPGALSEILVQGQTGFNQRGSAWHMVEFYAFQDQHTPRNKSLAPPGPLPSALRTPPPLAPAPWPPARAPPNPPPTNPPTPS